MVLILRDAERVSVPWKNGGGLTREIAAHPPGSNLDGFDWRVSIAQVRTAGAFSSFAGVERQMAVLSGALSLFVATAAPVKLSADSPPVSFAGDVPVYAQPVQAPVTDLNVMTRCTRCRAQLTRHTAEPKRLALDADTTLLIALSPLTLSANGTEWELSALDAARLEGVAQCELIPYGAGAAQRFLYYLAQIFAASRA